MSDVDSLQQQLLTSIEAADTLDALETVRVAALGKQGRRFKVVYNSSSLAGQIAAVESGLAVAVLTQCSAPAHLQVLGSAHGLGPLAPMEVAVYRSRASKGKAAVESLRKVLIQTLRQVEPVR